MAEKRKINKKRGVLECADLLYSGVVYSEIIRKLTENYGLSKSAVEKWIKDARPIAENRLKSDEAIKSAANAIAIEDAANELNISRKRVLEEYKKIAFFDVRKIFSENGSMIPIQEIDDETAGAIAGVESFDSMSDGELTGTTKKIKITDKRAALDSICRMMGYNAPDKSEISTKDGNPILQILPIKLVNAPDLEDEPNFFSDGNE